MDTVSVDVAAQRLEEIHLQVVFDAELGFGAWILDATFVDKIGDKDVLRVYGHGIGDVDGEKELRVRVRREVDIVQGTAPQLRCKGRIKCLCNDALERCTEIIGVADTVKRGNQAAPADGIIVRT